MLARGDVQHCWHKGLHMCLGFVSILLFLETSVILRLPASAVRLCGIDRPCSQWHPIGVNVYNFLFTHNDIYHCYANYLTSVPNDGGTDVNVLSRHCGGGQRHSAIVRRTRNSGDVLRL